jgi:hypothetical protein
MAAQLPAATQGRPYVQCEQKILLEVGRMKILKIDHIRSRPGPSTRWLPSGTRFWGSPHRRAGDGAGAEAPRLSSPWERRAGDSGIHGPGRAIAKFIESRGRSSHLALRVDNIEEALKELKEKGCD